MKVLLTSDKKKNMATKLYINDGGASTKLE